MLACAILTLVVPDGISANPHFRRKMWIRWRSPQLSFRLDAGTLDGLTRQQVEGAFKAAADAWNSVESTAPKIVIPPLEAPLTITDASFRARFRRDASGDFRTADRSTENLIVLEDSNGGLQFEGSVVAHTILWPASEASPPRLSRAVIAVRRRFLNESWTVERLTAAALHEFGHAMSLDHLESPVGASIESPDELPVMFPVTVGQRRLKEDDIASLRAGYPNPAFRAQYGQIRGVVEMEQNGQAFAVEGANVIAESLSDRTLVYSALSGILGDRPGEFVLAVRPGTYKLTIQRPHHQSMPPASIPFEDKMSLRDPVTVVESSTAVQTIASIASVRILVQQTRRIQ
jgi:hypothetical protein